jgi:WD40 repeat protein
MYLLTACSDDSDGRSVKLWSGEDGAFQRDVTAVTGSVEAFAVWHSRLLIHQYRFSPFEPLDKSEFVMLHPADGTPNVFDCNAGRITELAGGNGELIACACQNGNVLVWDGNRRKLLRTLAGEDDGAEATSVAISEDEHYIAAGYSNATIALWKLSKSDGSPLRGHDASVTTLAFDSEGSKLASGDVDGEIFVWDCATKRELQSFTAHDDKITAIAFIEDGLLVTAGADGTIKLWHWLSGHQFRVLASEESGVVDMSIQRGRIAASFSSGKVSLWGLGDTGRRRR